MYSFISIYTRNHVTTKTNRKVIKSIRNLKKAKMNK